MTIDLKKGSPVSLSKEAGGILVATLSWSGQTDVDIACMYELASGNKSVIQALGGNFGSLNQPPFIMLSGDARAGGTEILKINLGLAALKRALVFAYIYKGGNWGHITDASVTVHHPTQGDFKMTMTPSSSRSCALIELHNNGLGELELTPLERYFSGVHDEISDAYDYGFTFIQATKD